MTGLSPLTSTGRTLRDATPARMLRAPVDPVQLRADLIRAGVIREHSQDLPPLRSLEGVTVFRMTERDHQLAAEHIAQGRLSSHRIRDEYESSDRREDRYGGRR